MPRTGNGSGAFFMGRGVRRARDLARAVMPLARWSIFGPVDTIRPSQLMPFITAFGPKSSRQLSCMHLKIAQNVTVALSNTAIGNHPKMRQVCLSHAAAGHAHRSHHRPAAAATPNPAAPRRWPSRRCFTPRRAPIPGRPRPRLPLAAHRLGSNPIARFCAQLTGDSGDSHRTKRPGLPATARSDRRPLPSHPDSKAAPCTARLLRECVQKQAHHGV